LSVCCVLSTTLLRSVSSSRLFPSTASCCVVACSNVHVLLFTVFCSVLYGNATFHGVVGPQTSTTQLTSSSHQFLKTLKAVLIVHSFPFSTSMLMDFQR
ncbi:hypothetical protein F4604DRAFT_1795228, partial [Suillus subluteus]